MPSSTDELVAIDVHVHPRSQPFLDAMGERAQQMGSYFGSAPEAVSFDELADLYRARHMRAVLMNTTDEVSSGMRPVPNDEIARAVTKHPDVFTGFGVVDPAMGKLAVEEVRRCSEELGLRGIGELNPGRQGFYPNDPAFAGLYEEMSRQKMIALFHTGMMGSGAGTPGGMGYKLKYTRPIPYLDDVAAEYPELTIIGAHPSWPWQEESLAIAVHKSNFYIDLSGWSPKYFSESLVRYANGPLRKKMLFGSDWPLITPDRWLSDFDRLPLKEGVRDDILLHNARRLLDL